MNPFDDRQAAEKARKLQELRRLKNEKKRELEKKLLEVAKRAGYDVGG